MSALDKEVAFYLSRTYALSTQKTYRTHRKSYLAFCAAVGESPVPASSDLLCRYAAMLARSMKYSSVKQYMNIIRLLHLEWGLPNPMTANFNLQCVLRGIRRDLGDAPTRKLPITPDLLIKFSSVLDLRCATDSTLWAAALLSFFGLLRRSNVLSTPSNFNSKTCLCRGDITFHSWGAAVRIKKTKTIQNKERQLIIPLPRSQGHRLCPVQALFHAFSFSASAPSEGPAFVIPCASGFRPLTPAVFVSQVRRLLSMCGEDSSRYAGHSFRRGGASWAYNAGVPVETIKLLGDWKSQAYTLYIQPDLSSLQNSIKQMVIRTLY